MRWGGKEAFEYFRKNGIDFTKPIFEDSNYFMIGLLYSSRGDEETARKYFSKIKHKDMLSTLAEDF